MLLWCRWLKSKGYLSPPNVGKQSWVYEEEIFSDYNAMWFSPAGDFLAFLRCHYPQFYFLIGLTLMFDIEPMRVLFLNSASLIMTLSWIKIPPWRMTTPRVSLTSTLKYERTVAFVMFTSHLYFRLAWRTPLFPLVSSISLRTKLIGWYPPSSPLHIIVIFHLYLWFVDNIVFIVMERWPSLTTFPNFFRYFSRKLTGLTLNM